MATIWITDTNVLGNSWAFNEANMAFNQVNDVNFGEPVYFNSAGKLTVWTTYNLN